MNARLLAPLALLALALPATASAAPARPYDLNGDGRSELVMGLPEWADADGERVAALVYNGRKKGLLGSRRLIRPGDLGLDPATYSNAGQSIASGDFDRDGLADLAVGVPSYHVGEYPSQRFVGAVAVLYGARRFPGPRRAFFDGSEFESDFVSYGSSLVAGDLNGDRYADLVVTVPGDDPEGTDEDVPGSGSLQVLYGGPSGLTREGSGKIARANRDDAGFGRVLALGDLNGDRRQDVFEASPGSPSWVDDPPTPGRLAVALGEQGGPGPAQWIRGVYRGGPTALATGDVTGDGIEDVVAGVPVNSYVGEDETSPPGVVHIWPGRRGGVSRTPIEISQNTRGVPGSSQEGDSFGRSLLVARIDGDRYADMVVSATGEDRGRGRVTVLRGGPKGAARKGHVVLDRAAGKRTPFAGFGYRLSLLDLNGDRRQDLVIVGGEGRSTGVGRVTVLRGVKGGYRQRSPVVRDLSKLGLKNDSGSSPLVLGRDRSSESSY